MAKAIRYEVERADGTIVGMFEALRHLHLDLAQMMAEPPYEVWSRVDVRFAFLPQAVASVRDAANRLTATQHPTLRSWLQAHVPQGCRVIRRELDVAPVYADSTQVAFVPADMLATGYTREEMHAIARAALLRGDEKLSGEPLPLIEDDPGYWQSFAPNYTVHPPYENDESDAATREQVRWFVAETLAAEFVEMYLDKRVYAEASL